MQSAERHKTIILLRASTGPEPPEVARGRRSGSLGSHPANIFASQRTQQNDRGFVALGGLTDLYQAEDTAAGAWQRVGKMGTPEHEKSRPT